VLWRWSDRARRLRGRRKVEVDEGLVEGAR